MPPLRTIPPAKPIKTERTHEENQERAYIAASRRSDRSLEARVESARRASEIHKRRTGRSLRVTEQDVINEEMYEEEDDDLPAQIRRITAHLTTGNDPFNRRLQSYLANHIAMRSALGQAVADNWQQQQIQNNTINQYLNPAMVQQNQQIQQIHPFAFQTQMLPPQSTIPRSPVSYRNTPYPAPNVVQGLRPNTHVRAASIASPHDLNGHQQPATSSPQSASMSAQGSPVDSKLGDRRFSLPPQNLLVHTPHSISNSDQQSSKHISPPLSRTGSSTNLANHSALPPHLKQSPPSYFLTPSPGHDMSFNTFSATLPLESQQLLGGAPASDLNDPIMAAMMQNPFPQSSGSSSGSSAGFYSYNPNGSKIKSKTAAAAPSSTSMGMNATLAPSMLDASAASAFANQEPTSSDPFMSPFAPTGFGFGYDSILGSDLMLKDPDSLPNDSNSASGQITPGETDWNLWLNSQAYNDEPTTA